MSDQHDPLGIVEDDVTIIRDPRGRVVRDDTAIVNALRECASLFQIVGDTLANVSAPASHRITRGGAIKGRALMLDRQLDQIDARKGDQ